MVHPCDSLDVSDGSRSKQISYSRDRLYKPAPTEGVEHLSDAHRRTAERSRLISDALNDPRRCQINGIEDEFVRMLCLCVVPLEYVIGKIGKVECDDRLCPGANRGSENVAIVGVRKIQAAFEMFEPGYETVGDCVAHQFPNAVKTCRELWAAPQDALEALVQDPFRPSSAHDAGARNAD